ncbi:unnamed protein product, partial [Staurois parvus]
WLNSGHRVIWQGSGLRINRHDSGHPGHQVPGLSGSTAGTGVTRHQWGHRVHQAFGSSGSTAGIGSPGRRRRALESPGIRSFGSPAAQPRHLARQLGTRVTRSTTAALSQLARQRAPDQVPRGIIWINSGHRVNWPKIWIISAGSVHHAG